MKILDVPFNVIDWEEVSTEEHKGDKGFALWRVYEKGNIRVRIVEYSPGYVADHWCSRGHVLFVMEGELLTELSDGRSFLLKPGMSYHVSDDVNPHRSQTETGARLFIVD